MVADVISLCSSSGPEHEWQRRYNLVITVLRLKYLTVENVNLYTYIFYILLFVTNRMFCAETAVGGGGGGDQERYSEIKTIRITLKITLLQNEYTFRYATFTYTHTHQQSGVPPKVFERRRVFICDMGSAKCRRSTTVGSALLCFIRGTFHYHRSCVAVNNNRVYRGR